MTATIDMTTAGQGVSPAIWNKRLTAYYHGIATDATGGICEPVKLKIFRPRSANGSTVWAAIWINSEEHSAAGQGSAGGYGYDKPSAAAEEAIRRAGVHLSAPIAGRGNSAIRKALAAIAHSLGYATHHIVEG